MELKNIHKAYDTVVVDSVSLTIPKNQLTAFIGPNGAGKSTLVSIMSRLLQKDSGQLWIKGKEIEVWNSKELSKELSVLKQNQSFQVSLTVEELVSFGRYPYSKGKLSTLDYQMIDQALKHTNLLELRERSIQTLSGGQMQRVFIAMVLAQDTEIILLDEPLNHLDLKQAVEIMKLLRYMVENLDKTVVIVMHDLNMAINFSDYLVAFKEGKCEFHGQIMDVVTNQTLSELYEIDIEVIEVSGKKYITVK